YGRPESPLFGSRSPYKPQKVVVDRRGNIYVVGEGSTNGIIQLSQSGEFLGCYGVNRTQSTFGSMLRKLITSEEARSRLFMKTPPTPDKLDIDKIYLINSTTTGTTNEDIKQLNVVVKNMFNPDIIAATNHVSIAVDEDLHIFASTVPGDIHD